MKTQKTEFSKLIFIIFLALFLTAAGSAAQAANISGSIDDPFGLYTSGGTIYVGAFTTPDSTNPVAWTSTTTLDSYTIDMTGNSSGSYYIKAHYDANGDTYKNGGDGVGGFLNNPVNFDEVVNSSDIVVTLNAVLVSGTISAGNSEYTYPESNPDIYIGARNPGDNSLVAGTKLIDLGTYVLTVPGAYNGQPLNVQAYWDVDSSGSGAPTSGDWGGQYASNPITLEINNNSTVNISLDYEFLDITGQVTDTSVTPVPLEGVCVIARTAQCGGQFLGQGQTGADGNYTISGVPSGIDMYLSTDAQCVGSSSYTYVNEYYDNLPIYTCEGATAVSAGSSGINFALEEGGSISGTVTDADTSALIPGVYVFAWTDCGGPQVSGGWTDVDGNYTIHGLPTDASYIIGTDASGSGQSYFNEFYDNQMVCSGSVTFRAPGDTANFALNPAGAITGTVFQENGTDPLTGVSSLSVMATTNNPCSQEWQPPSQLYFGSVNPDGTYAIMGLQPGSYYIQTNNNNQSNYVNEWYTGSATPGSYSAYDCESASPVAITVIAGQTETGKNFDLVLGASIEGTVFDANFWDPIASIPVSLVKVEGENPCEDYAHVMGTSTQGDGSYIFRGVPPVGNFAVRTEYQQTGYDTPPDQWYVATWYDGYEGSYYCSDAFPFGDLGENVIDGMDFYLQTGGRFKAHIVDAAGNPLPNVYVNYHHEASNIGNGSMTDINGFVHFTGIPQGIFEISVRPDSGYLAPYEVDIYMGEGEEPLDMYRRITLQPGAKVSGYIQAGNPLAGVLTEYYVASGTKEMGWGETGANGYFEAILPPGEYVLGLEDDNYSMVPFSFTVAEGDVGYDKPLGDITAFDSVTGDVYSGSVTDATDGLAVISFLSDQIWSPANSGEIVPLSEVDVEDDGLGTYTYSSLISPSGETVDLMLIRFEEGDEGQESVTVISSALDQTGGGTVALNYSTGQDVYGNVLEYGSPVKFAEVFLIGASNDQFYGFAETDSYGDYIFYDVQDGTYRIEALGSDGSTIVKSEPFEVSGSSVWVDDLDIGVQTAEIYLYDDFESDLSKWNEPEDDYYIDLDSGSLYLGADYTHKMTRLSTFNGTPYIEAEMGPDYMNLWDPDSETSAVANSMIQGVFYNDTYSGAGNGFEGDILAGVGLSCSSDEYGDYCQAFGFVKRFDDPADIGEMSNVFFQPFSIYVDFGAYLSVEFKDLKLVFRVDNGYGDIEVITYEITSPIYEAKALKDYRALVSMIEDDTVTTEALFWFDNVYFMETEEEDREKFKGDFNGDGNSDFLLWSQATGDVYVWLMSGTTILQS
ncbi:MAG: carboxypeptidase regulatory-like domain-containing protein, partial [Deltaproteobacteria bacterium]|nr:carboxypeptidase regulatory-like domain-containing protein [Deltaproteobacteria bacterium]